MNQFEVKYFDEDADWMKVSERLAMERISDYFDHVSPVLMELLAGKEIVTSDAIIRIKR